MAEIHKFMMKAGIKAGINKKGRLLIAPISLILKMSRAGLEPATHWLKASCSTD
jgi:hypothetical protein